MKKFAYSIVLAILLVAVLAFMAIVVLTLSKSAEPFPEGSESALRLARGPLNIASFDENFIDDSRVTAANGSYAGADTRALAATVWYPSENIAQPYPLIVYSHGFTSSRQNGAYLAEHLASNGFVVVAADYPLTNISAPGGPSLGDVANQPADVIFLIDTLLASSGDESHRLAGKIDEGRIGVMGVSLGGLTSTLVAYHPSLRDPRIGAAISIAGPTSLFKKSFFAEESMPFLMLAGDRDVIVPYEIHARPVLSTIPNAKLITLRKGSHTGFSGGTRYFRALANPDVLGCYAVTGNIEDGEEDEWAGLLGPASIGLDYGAASGLCENTDYPKTMNVLRQQMLSKVVVAAFFQSVFEQEENLRAAAVEYLQETAAKELEDLLFE
ncbi:MAG: CocE/NonD family hydrolase [Pseudomonadota bacterium]